MHLDRVQWVCFVGPCPLGDFGRNHETSEVRRRMVLVGMVVGGALSVRLARWKWECFRVP